jgi:cupin fold WbuC family metalloprotein
VKRIYSKVEPDKLLHIIKTYDDVVSQSDPREDVVPDDNFIQCSTLKMDNGKTFRPHYHILKDIDRESIAQESWVVIKGKVKFIFYDLDHEIIDTCVLNEGDISFTLYGGHTYEVLQDDTIVYEYKTGPYYGQQFDKRFIDE